MNDLLSSLEAAISETERIARAASKAPWKGEGKVVYDADFQEVASDAGWVGMDEGDVAHIVHNDPDRVLRRVARDRKLLELHTPRAHDVLAFVEEGKRQNPSRPYEPTGALIYTACPTCGGRDWDLDRSDFEPCATLRLLAEDYGMEVPDHG